MSHAVVTGLPASGKTSLALAISPGLALPVLDKDDARNRRMPLLFSYGTLQREDVQVATFGRRLTSWPDELVGFEQSVLKVDDPDFVATSGKALHAIVKYNGSDVSRVSGTVLELTEDELAAADGYEPAGYKRVLGRLKSGGDAWVYADACFS